MNYHIYHEAYQFDFTFNFVNTVGDLQTVILQALNIPKNDLLFILHNDKILGKDYLFAQDLSQAELFDINLFVVTDYYHVGQGTRDAYNQWLLSQITNTDLIIANQQLLFYNTHHNLSTPNLNFFTSTGTTNGTSTTGSTSNTSRRPTSNQSPSSSSSPANNTGSTGSSRPAGSGLSSSRPGLSRPAGSGLSSSRPAGSGLSSSRPAGSGSGSSSRPAATAGSSRPAGAGSGSNSRPAGAGGSTRPVGSAGSSRPTSSILGNLFNSAGNGSNISGGELQNLLQNFISGGVGHNLGGGSGSDFSNIFDTMINNNIYDLAVTMTEGPDGSNIGLVATGSVSGNGDLINGGFINGGFSSSDFFQRLLSDLEPVPVTLTRESINQLPIFKFNELPAEIKESHVCSICLEDFSNDDQTRVLLCKHYYHKDCIDRWLTQENVRCPLCRHDIRDPQPASNVQGSPGNVERVVEAENQEDEYSYSYSYSESGSESDSGDAIEYDLSNFDSENMEELLDGILEEQIEKLSHDLTKRD
jgi:hypothetical protein